MPDVKYPHVEVQLTGQDGNAFFIIGRVSEALRRKSVPAEEVEEFQQQATSGDYNHLLQTCCAWVTVH